MPSTVLAPRGDDIHALTSRSDDRGSGLEPEQVDRAEPPPRETPLTGRGLTGGAGMPQRPIQTPTV